MIKCGSFNENESNLGIAHFTEHMLFKGTTKRNSQEISEAIEGIGGILNAETSLEHTRYFCIVPMEYWKTGTEILSDMIWDNLIPEDEFSREKQVVLEELKMYNDDPSSRVRNLLFIHMHPGYKNRQFIGGEVETVSNITRDQMLDFIDTFYTPNNIIVVATGNIEHTSFVKYIEDYCNGFELKIKKLPSGQSKFVPDKLNFNDLIEKKDIIQSHLCWGIFGPKPSDKDYVVGEVIATLLGGNSSSKLYQIIREQQGLAYTVHMDVQPISDCSILMGYVGLDGENINNVKEIILSELNKLQQETISDLKLQQAKAYIKGKITIQMETPSSKNDFICGCLIDKTSTSLDDYLKAIDSITLEQIKKFAIKYFTKTNICFTQVIAK